MADVKDILGVSRLGGSNDKAEPKEKKEKVQRPAGMSREAFALLGGVHPLIPSQLTEGLKRQDSQAKPKASTKGIITYQWKPFRNQGRTDNLQLSHWVKGYKDASGRIRDAEDGDYTFAKFNKPAQVYRYDDEEWNSLLSNDTTGWSRAETDYLLDMCETFDLRFPVVIDRYNFPGGPPRTLEDLKERYYWIARRLLLEREGGEARCAHQVLVKHPYDKRHEEDRRAALNILLSRNMQRDQDDQMVLEEARQIEERRRAEAAQKRAAAATTSAAAPSTAGADAPVASTSAGAAAAAPAAAAAGATTVNKGPLELPAIPPGMSSLFTADIKPMRPPKAGVYARGPHTRETATAAATALPGGQRVQKALEQALTDNNAVAFPRVSSREVAAAWLSLREAVVQLVEVRKQLQSRQDGHQRKDKRRR